MFRPSLARTCAAIATASLLSFASPSRAFDLQALLARVDTSTEATLYLVPPMAVFRTSLDEAYMQAEACRYTTSDPAAVRAMVALVKGANIGTRVVYQKPDIREGVYLTLGDGVLLKLLMQDNFGGKLPVDGIAETSVGGNLQTASITASQTTAVALRDWAARRGGVGVGSACSRQSAAPAEPVAPLPQ